MSIRFKKFTVADYGLDDLVKADLDIDRLRRDLEEGIVFKIPHDIPLKVLERFRNTMLDSLTYEDPGYIKRQFGGPNNFRVHWDDEHQATRGKFMSWSFYPWNASSFEWFDHFRNLFVLRNKLAGLSPDKYIDMADQDFVARIAGQFYPSGAGYMEEHMDPHNVHQFAIPTMLLSSPGEDFINRGFFLLNDQGEKVYIDHNLSFGDLFLFHTSIPHGVGLVDQHLELDKSKKLGRLMMIAAVNAVNDQNAFQSKSRQK